MRILEKYKGLNVLITGATSGIGYEFARLFAGHGFTLLLVSRSMEKLRTVRDELQGKSSVIHIIQCDLSDEKAAENVFMQVNELSLKVDILINNAGVGLMGENTSVTPRQTTAMISLNVITPTGLSILFAQKMAKQKKGYILNVGSLVAFFSLPFFSSYAASKAYILNYSRALRAELAPHRVSVTCLLPGFTRTNFDSNAEIESASYKRFSRLIAMEPAVVATIGIRSLFKRKAVCIPGIGNKVAYLLSRLLPKGFISSALFRILSKMYNNDRISR